MKNVLIIAFLKMQYKWNRVVAASIAADTGMHHRDLVSVNPKYRESYSKYQESKERLIGLGVYGETRRG